MFKFFNALVAMIQFRCPGLELYLEIGNHPTGVEVLFAPMLFGTRQPIHSGNGPILKILKVIH